MTRPVETLEELARQVRRLEGRLAWALQDAGRARQDLAVAVAQIAELRGLLDEQARLLRTVQAAAPSAVSAAAARSSENGPVRRERLCVPDASQDPDDCSKHDHVMVPGVRA